MKKEKIIKLFTNKIIIFSAIAILAIAILALFVEKPIVRNPQKEKMATEPLLQYEVINKIQDNEYKLLVKIISEDGLETITYKQPETNEEITVACNNRTQVAIDYIVKEKQDYEFKIKQVGIDEVTEKLNYEATNIPTIGTGEKTHIAHEIKYTWEELNTIAKEISYNYGTEEGQVNNDTIELNVSINGIADTLGIGDWTTVNGKRVRILGFNHDELTKSDAYGEGNTNIYAGISFEYVESLAKSQMNTANSIVGGWETCTLRNTLNTTIYGGLENKEYIKEVNKVYTEKETSDGSGLKKSQDKLWLLSSYEIWANGSIITADGQRYKFYSNGGSSVKGFAWWTRSTDGRRCQGGSCISIPRYKFSNVNGTVSSNRPTTLYDVTPGFAI